MAIVTTVITPSLTMFPWSDLDGQQPDSIQPIGELMANSVDEDVTLSGAGDTQEVRWSITLPQNFNYVLQDITANISLAFTNTWSDLASMILFDLSGQVPAFNWSVGMKSEGVTRGPGTVGQRQTWAPNYLPKFQLGSGGIVQTTFVDLTAEEPAAVFNGTARFLIYTVAQRYNSAVNTPLLVR